MAQNQIRGGQIRSGTITNEQIASNAEIALSKIAGGTALNNRVSNLESDAIITREVPSGSLNGTNVTFTLANTPISGTEQVFLNGLLQDPGAGNSYTISGAVITFLSAPLSGDEIHVTYATDTYVTDPNAATSNNGVDYGSVLLSESAFTPGDQCSFAIRADNALFAWGFNSSSQLGLIDTTNRTAPTKVGSSDWSKVTTSLSREFPNTEVYTLAIKTNGTLWAWGGNGYNQLGDGTTTRRTAPTQIGSDTNWIRISGGALTSLGIKSDGTLWGWGWNTDGAVGDGTNTQRSTPTRVGNATNWSKVQATSHVLALKTNGTLWSWGYNANGQIGDGSTVTKNSPVQIGSSTWNEIAVGWLHSVAIRSDGTLWAWGHNNFGQLGDGTTTQRTSPVQIGSGTNWSKVRCGNRFTIALKTDGTLWAWGTNVSGQLGDGTTTQRNSPVQIGSSSNWVDIAAGGAAGSMAIDSNGTLYAWGLNDNGQLGNGTTVTRYSPKKSEVDLKN